MQLTSVAPLDSEKRSKCAKRHYGRHLGEDSSDGAARRGTVEPYLVVRILVEDDDLKRWQKTRKYDTIHTRSKKNYDFTYLGDRRIALQEAREHPVLS